MANGTVGAIIQARMGSTRLPGKVLKPIDGNPLLEYIVRRLQRSDSVDKIVLATSRASADDRLVEFAQERDLEYHRGPEKNVLQRYIGAAQANDIDTIVRVCADNPLTSPEVLDRLVRTHFDVAVAYTYSENVPNGFGLRVVDTETLRDVQRRDIDDADREHVTLYIEDHPDQFETVSVDFDLSSDLRLTVDVPEDLQLIRTLAEHLDLVDVTMEEVVEFLGENPDIRGINADVNQKAPRAERRRPAISVVTRTYNSEEYIERAIQSVRDQTIDDDRYEHIVVDDGSTDGTADIVASFDEVRFIKTQHTGAIETLNRGIRESRGKYVISLDADDFFEPEILDRMYTVLEENLDIAYVYSDYYERTKEGETVCVDTSDNVFDTILIGIMFRKEALFRAGLYDERMNFPEYDLLVKLRRLGMEGRHVPEPLFTYWRHEDSMTANEQRVKEGYRELEEKYGKLNVREY